MGGIILLVPAECTCRGWAELGGMRLLTILFYEVRETANVSMNEQISPRVASFNCNIGTRIEQRPSTQNNILHPSKANAKT